MPARDNYKFKPVAYPKRRRHWSGIGTLILLCLISILALALLFAFLATESRSTVWRGIFTQKTVGKNGGLFADVTLGMPRSAVGKFCPDLRSARARRWVPSAPTAPPTLFGSQARDGTTKSIGYASSTHISNSANTRF